MLYFAILLMIICSFLITAGQALFKFSSAGINFKRPYTIFLNGKILLGFFLYIVYFILSIIAYRYGDLIILFPFVNLCMIWNIIVARRFLGETMTLNKYAGTLLIFMGCIVILF